MKRIFLISSIALGIVFGVITHRSKKRPIINIDKIDTIYLDTIWLKPKIKKPPVKDKSPIIDTVCSLVNSIGINKFEVFTYAIFNQHKHQIDSAFNDTYAPRDNNLYISIRHTVDSSLVKQTLSKEVKQAWLLIKQQRKFDKLTGN